MSGDNDISQVMELLLFHRETLETIRIGTFDLDTAVGVFDVSQFSRLEVLQVSRYSFPEPLEFSVAMGQKLLAPGLKTFCWHFSKWYDMQESRNYFDEEWDAFGENEERWLKELAAFAASTKSSLRTISIRFTPDGSDIDASSVYPWDRMDRVKEYIRRFGIDLQYNTPVLTREMWQKVMAAD